MEEKQQIQIGGNVDKAVKGEYVITPRDVLSEAWQLTNANRLSINLGLIFVFFLGLAIVFISSQYFGGLESALANPEAMVALNLLVTIAIYPFIAGVEMMGVLHAVGIKTRPRLVFSFLRRGSWVALCAVMTSMFISLGLQLFIIPGIFIAVLLSLTIPLVVEKQLSPAKAIVLSIKALRFQMFNIFFVYLALFMGLIVAAMPFALFGGNGSGGGDILAMAIFFFLMSYLAPLYFNAKGVMYRDIFGMQLQAVKSDFNDNSDNSSGGNSGGSQGNGNSKGTGNDSDNDIFIA